MTSFKAIFAARSRIILAFGVAVFFWIVQGEIFVAVAYHSGPKPSFANVVVGMVFFCLILVAAYVVSVRTSFWVAHGYATYVVTALLYRLLSGPEFEENSMHDLIEAFSPALIVSLVVFYAVLVARRVTQSSGTAVPN